MLIRVLVIDDSEESRKPITEFLSSRGVNYDTVESPQEAWVKMNEFDYDLVFLDLDLGGGLQDGIGILAWMKNNSKLFPTVIVSASANLSDAIRAEVEYAFVKLRLEQSQIARLADLLDIIISREDGLRPLNIFSRILVSFLGVGLAGAGASLAIWLKGYSTEDGITDDLAIGVLVFAVVCALVHIFSESIVKKAMETLRNILSFYKSKH